MHGFNGHSWAMGWGWILGLIVLVVVIWLIAKAINMNKQTDQLANKSALEILKERYARGEIDKQEFEERKKDLM